MKISAKIRYLIDSHRTGKPATIGIKTHDRYFCGECYNDIDSESNYCYSCGSPVVNIKEVSVTHCTTTVNVPWYRLGNRPIYCPDCGELLDVSKKTVIEKFKSQK